MLMRLAGVVLAVVLATSIANADPLPFEIVRMLPETNQVLVFDRGHNTHVLLQPGVTFGDYTVVEISGIDMIVQKGAERFVVYPKEAKFLALTVLPPKQNAAPQPPVIYGRSNPAAAPAPAVIVDTNAKRPNDTKKAADSKASVAQSLGMALADAPPARATSRVASPTVPPPVASKMKP